MSQQALSADQFIVLVARYERRVRAFIASIAFGRPDWIDEILQSTYLVAWQKLASFEYRDATPDEEAVRWICTIARFESLNFMRKQRSTDAVRALDLAELIADCQLERADLMEERFHALKNCLERLTTRQRELLHLRYWSSLSIAEMAARLDRQAGAIHTSLSKIRKALERCIDDAVRVVGRLT